MPLTMGTGNKEMHPLLISIANIHAGTHMKATSHAYVLVAYLPIPKFHNVSPAVQAVLSAHIFHRAVLLVMQNLKMACKNGEVMSDPNGHLCVVHTPLVAWIADYPEQLLIACTSSRNSLIFTATAEQFGDPTPAPPRLCQQTLDTIKQACTACDPCDNIAAFHNVCLMLRLSGVVQSFWEDWGDACPLQFLTPDVLHAWHKFFFDHCVQWVINIMGGEELDHRLSVLQPGMSMHNWPDGISKLKQTRGRDHWEIERLLAVVAAGVIPGDVLCMICAITEFIFLVQSAFHCDETLHVLSEALWEFHHYKPAILAVGGQQGKRGSLDNFQIPKLELAQHVSCSTRAMGAPYQWSSDITERCHITHMKNPYHLSNCRDFHSQCCHFLDRQEKQHLFHLFTTLKMVGASLINEMAYKADLMQLHYPELTWMSTVSPNLDEHLMGQVAPSKSVFNNPRFQISSDRTTTLLLTIQPRFPGLSIDNTCHTLLIAGFQEALGDFFSGHSYTAQNGHCLAICHIPNST